MDKELLYNASGAKDETAYKAIINVMKEERAMGVMGANKGEVWEVVNGQGTRSVVLLQCFEDYAATIMLQDFEPKENSVTVRARGIMYADAGRPGYIFYDKLVNFVRDLTEAEFTTLKKAVNEALELPGETQGEIEKLREELKRSQEIIERTTDRMEEIGLEKDRLAEELENVKYEAERGMITPCVGFTEDYSLREDLAAARKEAEIYKGLYEVMLQRALG